MIKTLLKMRFASAFSAMSRNGVAGNGKKKKPLSIALVALLYTFIIAVFAFIFTGVAILLAPALVAIGADWFYFLVFIGIDVSLVFIFGVFETKSEIFECRDNALLLSLPIKPRDIVISRVLSVIIWNYIESLVVFLPAIIVYACVGGSYLGVIGSSIVLLFLPLLPTAISCIIGFFVSVVTAKFKKKTFTTVLVFFVFFGAYMVGYTALIDGMESMIANVGIAAGAVGRFAFLKAIGEAAILKPLPLVLLCLVSVLSSALTVIAISLGFSRIISINVGGKKVVYRAKKSERRSPLYALTKKELQRYFSSSAYIINTSLGIIFTAVIAVVALINRDMLKSVAQIFGEILAADGDALLSVILVSVMCLCASMSYISACSLSLEGKSLWVIKSMPISGRDVLLSKVLSHFIIALPLTFIASVLLCAASGAWSLIWYFILVPQICNAICALAGLLYNCAFPRFDFANEVSVIKNSLSSFLTMISVMLLSFGLAALAIWLATLVTAQLVALVHTVVALAVFSVLVVILIKYATPKYERL